MALGNRLSTVRKKLTKNSSQSLNSIPDIHALYLSVLQAVTIPIMGIGRDHHINITKNISELKTSSFSLMKDSTIYITASTMQIFKSNLKIRLEIMKNIHTIESKVFSSAGQKVYDLVLMKFVPMTDIKVLTDQIAFLCSAQLKQTSDQVASVSPTDALSGVQIDQYLLQIVDMFLTILQNALENNPNEVKSPTSYEIRKHALFQAQNMKAIISKYFLTASQMLQDNDGDLAVGVIDLFDVSPVEHSNTLRALKVTHTAGSVFKFLTTRLENLTRGTLDGYLKDDFPTPQLYALFLEREIQQLTQCISIFGRNNPQAPGQAGAADAPKYMPATQKISEKYYRILATLCFDRDIAEGTGGQMNLSKLSKDILNECALSWNISKEFKDASIFDSAVKKYAAGQLGLSEMFFVFNQTRKVPSKDLILRNVEIDFLLGAYSRLHIALSAQQHQILELPNVTDLNPRDCEEVIEIVGAMLLEMHSDPLCTQSNSIRPLAPAQVEEEMAEEIRFSAEARLDYVLSKIEEAFPGPENLLLRLTKIIQSSTSDLRKYKIYFTKEILGSNFVYLIAGIEYIKSANTNLQLMLNLDPETPMVQVLECYDYFRELYDFCLEIKVPMEEMMHIEGYFLPIIDIWLARTDSKWVEWVVRAYALDEFEPMSSPKCLNSNSVMDVFSAFQSALSFVSKFRFDDAKKQELLKTQFISAMYKSLETYCLLIFEEFEEMDKANDLSPFSRTHIVKFNNILFAQELIMKLVEQLEISDETGKGMDMNKPEGEKINMVPGQTSFRIKILGARHLPLQNAKCPDAYCVTSLGDQIVGATNVVENNSHPFWYCENSVILPESLNTNSKAFLQFQVFHDNQLGNEIPCGRASVFLRDENLNNFLTYNAQLSMRPQGSISVRIRREGEIINTFWYVERTRELLRFTLIDILHVLSSKITRVLEHAVFKITKATQGRTMFGVVLTPSIKITDALVESKLKDVFVFMNSTLSLLNKLLDRRFEDMLEAICPQLKKTQNVQLLSPNNVLRRIDTKTGSNTNSPSLSRQPNEAATDYRKLPLVIELIWNDILQWGLQLVESFVVDEITDVHLRQAMILEPLIEYMKSLFHCRIGVKEKVFGIPLAQLQTGLYRQLRRALEGILPGPTTNQK